MSPARLLIAAALAAVASLSCAQAAGPPPPTVIEGPPPPTVIQDKTVRLSESYGSRETLSFRLRGPAEVTLEATWSGPATGLALILNGPGQTAAYARRDGASPLTLTYRVTAEQLRRGTLWSTSLVNFSRRGPVTGRLRLVYAAAAPAYSCRFINDYPRNREPGWSDDCQGLANDESNWYVTQTARLWKFPVGRDLNGSASGALSVGIPDELRRQGYNHFGDPDFHDGRLFVPLEGRQPCKIALFDQNLRFLGAAELTRQTHAPWCAIDPADGLLYSSNFDGVQELAAYRPELAGGRFALRYVRALPLRNQSEGSLRVNAVQGGAFSPTSGLLYLVSDTGSGGGLLAFDAATGRLVQRTAISYSPGFPNYQELEGLTVWNLDSGRALGIRGQVHVVLIENDVASADDLWIKHFDVTWEGGGAVPVRVP